MKLKIRLLVVAQIAPFILMGASVLPAYAATEGQIMANINRGVTINGVHRSIAPKYVRMARNYLASHDLTPEQLDKINAAINGARASWEASGTTTYLAMNEGDKKKLEKAAVDAAQAAEAKVKLENNKATVIDKKGREYPMTLGDGNAIKPVGANYSTLGAFSLFILILFAGALGVTWHAGLLRKE